MQCNNKSFFSFSSYLRKEKTIQKEKISKIPRMNHLSQNQIHINFLLNLNSLQHNIYVSLL